MSLSRLDIERRAQEILWRAGAVTVPVDIEKVVRSLGAQLHLQTFEDHVSGLLAVQGGLRHILVNATHHPNRQRFTAAHECGHLVLHHQDGDELFIDKQIRVYQRVGVPSDAAYTGTEARTTPQQEREANQFASALLMPEPLVVERLVGTSMLDEQDVAALALGFGVSEQAMSIRLQQLGLLTI